MTEENKQPWVTDNSAPTPPAPPAPPAPPTNLDALKAKADELGVQYAANIGADTLASRVADAEAAKAAAEADANKGEPTVVNPSADINAKPSEEKVSEGYRQVDPASLDFQAQAPLEVINMVSQGKTLKEAMKIHKKSRAAKKAREEAKAAAEEAEE